MKILSLDGGGYLGLSTATFLAELERHFETTCHSQFDLFCGTSTGAIIAVLLASGMTAKEIASLYTDFGPKVFDNRFPFARQFRTYCLGFVISMYGNTALRAALERELGDKTLGDIKKSKKLIVVPAFSLTSGRPRVFKTDHADGLTTDDGYRASDIALASSAAPVFLPVVEIKSPTSGIVERFCDGGIFANHPALLGYAEAVYHLKVPPKEIKLLSISTPRSSFAELQINQGFFNRHILRRGLLGWKGPRIVSTCIEATSTISNEILKRLLAERHELGFYERVELSNPGGLELDVATPAATHSLEIIGLQEATKSGTRERLNSFFT